MLGRRKYPGRRERERGASTVELALLSPFLLLVFLSLVQLVIYVQASTSVQYAAFAAARAYQVYGTRTLEEIGYRRYGGNQSSTNKQQTIAEAAAEKVIFESLPWEHRNVVVEGSRGSLARYYRDGNDRMENGSTIDGNEGVVRINFLTSDPNEFNRGVQVIYCMPVLFPGLDNLFEKVKKEWPCRTMRFGDRYRGIAIMKEVRLGREPETL